MWIPTWHDWYDMYVWPDKIEAEVTLSEKGYVQVIVSGSSRQHGSTVSCVGLLCLKKVHDFHDRISLWMTSIYKCQTAQNLEYYDYTTSLDKL